MLTLGFVILVTINSFLAAPTVYKDCGSVKGKVLSVDISPCTTQPCQLKKGTKPQITIAYQSLEQVSSGTASVHGKLGPISVPFPLPDEDLCKFSTPPCPIAANSNSTYSNSIEVLSSYPSLRVTVRWELLDSQSNDLVCVEMPVSIVD